MAPTPRAILVTGGTGTLGAHFVRAAHSAGHRVRIASRWAADGPSLELERVRVDLLTGEGLEDSVRGVDVILHAATDPRRSDTVDVDGTRRLTDAAARAGVDHLVYPSIVGIDRLPWAYYDAKLRAEAVVADSTVPHTTVRITQFHSFLEEMLARAGRLPLMPLPTRFRFQSIAAEEAAAHLLERAEGPPAGRSPDVAGPEVQTLGDLARSWLRVRGKKRWILPLPIPGALARGFREGCATAPDRAVGRETWEEWLRRA